METDKEVSELENNLKYIKLKPISIWLRIGLLCLILGLVYAGYRFGF